ncbi:DEAD/DEAH box helicase family protein [Desulfospira joergensenii]|uniref:DEAD/DEAH box helicase family protein n=1 Tax=Desulfospira joergensenii TaxID=53329 RepID=UPI0003B7A365|nr:DEAD/DEAH box helicase family protein [Desulfospira joergensenii]
MAEWLNADEAANYLGISSSSLYSMAQQGRVPGHKLGKMWRFNKSDLDAWVRANRPINEFFMSAESFIEGNDLLRDPQKEGHAAALDFFESDGGKAIMQLPVGCGKSGLISLLPFGISEGRVLVIAPNVTIRNELQKALDITNKRTCFWHKCKVLAPEVMSAGPYIAVLDGKDANVHDCDRSHIVVTNIQQLASSADRWLPQFPDDYFDMILVDEGHHSAAPSWMKVFDKFPKAKVVNLTATPFRSDKKNIEGTFIYRYSFKRAMIKGYIKKLQAIYVAPEELYFTWEGDDYHHTLEEVMELKEETWFSRGVAMSPECNYHIVDASLDKLEKLRQSGTNHQLIAVAMSVNHAKAIRSLYSERGYEAAEIYSDMPPDKQAEVMQKLRSGMLDCLVQVQMLGEGFDHPHLSVAAIFRPFRSLPPYVQFIGRTMRVVVQNDPRHPDNYGYVVTHIGMNLDQQLEDFRDMEREDRDYFEELISGEEPEPPAEATEGRARMKLRNDMVVDKEIVSEFFEEDFLDTDDAALLDELKAHAESLGFDAADILKAIKSKKKSKRRVTEASAPFPVLPQKQRQEARKRLNEEVNRTAKLLLNRCDLQINGRDIAFKLYPGVTGNNFVAAVQLVNKKLKKRLEVEGVSGKREKMKTENFIRAQELLEDVLNSLTRLFKKRMADDG